jgi:hypothetical protein
MLQKYASLTELMKVVTILQESTGNISTVSNMQKLSNL